MDKTFIYLFCNTNLEVHTMHGSQRAARGTGIDYHTPRKVLNSIEKSADREEKRIFI